MPHLAPLSWIGAVCLFWVLLMVMMSVVWWVQLPMFSFNGGSTEFSPLSSWKWS